MNLYDTLVNKNNEDVMSCADFGHHLLTTGDLDPMYIALTRSNLSSDQMKRWLLGYWSFYHGGVASTISELEGSDFWDGMRRAYHEKWPRGAERRYFRGPKCLEAINQMQKRFPAPEDVVNYMASGNSFGEIKSKVCEFYLFGDWIAFKIADMSERVLGRSVSTNGCHLEIFKDPRQGAALLLHGNYTAPLKTHELESVVLQMESFFRQYPAPPHYDRPVNVQEVETILCKYKSHYKGSYPLYKDIREIGHAMSDPRWGSTSLRISSNLPKMPE